MALLKMFKDVALPVSPQPDALYFIKNGISIKLYVTDSAGTPYVVDEDQAGVGTDSFNIQASEDLAAGDYINIWNSAGNFRARKASATSLGTQADGFIVTAALTGANALVYFEGTNTMVTGQTPGTVFLSTTPGLGSPTPPTGSGNVIQTVGIAVSATNVNFEKGSIVVLA